MNNNNIIENINKYLIESENFASQYLPLKQVLLPIQNDVNNILEELKQKSQSAADLSDKVFYLNRYTDLVKKIESVFDTRNKRLQQTLSILSKTYIDNNDTIEEQTNKEINDDDSKTLTPEEANEILKILNKEE